MPQPHIPPKEDNIDTTELALNWPLEDHPEMIRKRNLEWSRYQGNYTVRMVHGQDLYLCPGDAYSEKLFVYRRQHIGLLLALARIPIEGVAIDIGANIGYVSAWLAKRPDVTKLFSFEPNPRLAPILRKNVDPRKGEIISQAVGAKSGTIEIGIHRTNSGWSGPSTTNEVADRVAVDGTSIDDFALNTPPLPAKDPPSSKSTLKGRNLR